MFNLSPKAKKMLKQPYKLLGLLILATLILYFGIINPVLNRLEKNKFEEAFTHLNQLAAGMQSTAGKAEEFTTLKSCGYSGQTFDRGWRSCSVTIDLSFPSFDLEKSNDYFLAVSKLFPDEPSSQTSKNKTDKFQDIDFHRQVFVQSYRYKSLDCQIEYEYMDISHQSTRVPDTESGLYIEMICFKEARAEHYPVDD